MIAGEIQRTRLIPLAATLAAIYGTLRLAPISVVIGGLGRVFTASEFIAPLLGIMLGPYAGSLAAVVGTFLGIIFTGRMNFFGLDFLPSMMNALVLGFLMRKRWLPSALLYLVLLVLWFVHPSALHFVSVPLPNGRLEFPFVWLHIVAWLFLLSPVSNRSVEWISGRSALRVTGAGSLLALIGTTAQNLTGNLLFASMATPLMGISPEALERIWSISFCVYPVERLIIVVGATTIIVAMVKALRAAGFL